jgi:hypothetical protein
LSAAITLDRSRTGRYGNDVQSWVKEREDQGNGVVNAWIAIDDNFSCHVFAV